MAYRPRHPVRIVTAAALFDGHDASINIIRRLLQEAGAEVIHLGHNRGAEEVVDAAIHEDAQAIAVSSYQGGHVEYFKYMRELLARKGGAHVRIFGGGGGVIVPREIRELEASGVDRIFSPEDGRVLGLEGMIDLILERADFAPHERAPIDFTKLPTPDQPAGVARLITLAELLDQGRTASPPDASALRPLYDLVYPAADRRERRAPVLGITGPGGAGKSSLTDELVLRFLESTEANSAPKRVAILSVDPTKKRTGGALLGDRIRMNSIRPPEVYMRSLATRSSSSELSEAIGGALKVCQAVGFDLIIVESAGTGQKDSAIAAIADLALYVMTAEFGAQSQLEKIEMIDLADAIAINKFERRGSEDALVAVRKQYRRGRKLFGAEPRDEALPVFGTIASQFNDPGVSRLFVHLLARLAEKERARIRPAIPPARLEGGGKPSIIPSKEVRYLSLVADAVRRRSAQVARDVEHLRRAEGLQIAASVLGAQTAGAPAPSTEEDCARAARVDPQAAHLLRRANQELAALGKEAQAVLAELPGVFARYGQSELAYEVRGRELRTPLFHTSLSHTPVRKVALPRYQSWADRLSWALQENVPGSFPFTAGVFPLKRTGEDPARMFAGEGPPEQTNARFHLLAKAQPAVRLSTAFDSVTLYGEDPHERPDIFGKIGESGVSVATVEDAEKLYAGFDLVHPTTSVSMTINGPAPIVLAFFMNTAVRQAVRRELAGRLSLTPEQCLRPDHERGARWADVRALIGDEDYARVRRATLCQVRGTVQADILKEDQAQNTCIFSTEFALKMMGDMQAYFIEEDVQNYYSVSISGYHIAEAGANPITQLALTLANGFTYVQYYLSRGMKVDDFAPNLSFFFSNGLDPEYTVIGRVARRIWAVALRDLYGAGERSQKLKYHIQTSGRSLHAMEMDFNDIRTTLQALMALEDNCNSLHTNAFDEALTTPTESSVRRALAIQMIINKELGLAKNENPLQGSFVVEELTELVEAAVLAEFDRLTERGGVLGAMETQYQRNKIQEESLYYERQKHDGSLPIVGVNTFKNPAANYEAEADKVELRRAPPAEKQRCIQNLRDFQARHAGQCGPALARLKETALDGRNIFRELMETVNVASLGQITRALYEVGGQYRRNM